MAKGQGTMLLRIVESNTPFQVLSRRGKLGLDQLAQPLLEHDFI
jgi:hypothetical protein